MNFAAQLRGRGLKSTPQRSIILSEILKAGHIDIDALNVAVNKSFNIPLGTLYRAIAELTGAGVLKSVSPFGLKTHHEISKDEHAHFVCKKCNSIIDFPFQVPIKELKSKLPSKSITDVSFIAYGICENCDKIL